MARSLFITVDKTPIQSSGVWSGVHSHQMTIKLSEKVEKDVSISMHIARFFSFSKDSQVVSLAQTQKRTSKGPVLVTAAIGSAIIVRTSTEMSRQKHHSLSSKKMQSSIIGVKQKNDNSIEAHILGNSGVGIRGICAENPSRK